MKKRSSAVILLFMFVVVILAQLIFIVSFGRPGELFGSLESAIVQIYGNSR